MTPTEQFKRIYTEYIKRPGASDLMAWLDSTDFFTAPASTRFHGDHEGGLCEHSVNVWRELNRIAHAYPEIRVSVESAAIVSLLHDLCKIGCYKVELRNKKEGGIWKSVPTYVFSEDFCFGGHGSKSVYLAQRFIELTDEEAVAINCHMGFADRSPGDYSLGAAYEKYPLAWLLHVADESASYIIERK